MTDSLELIKTRFAVGRVAHAAAALFYNKKRGSAATWLRAARKLAREAENSKETLDHINQLWLQIRSFRTE